MKDCTGFPLHYSLDLMHLSLMPPEQKILPQHLSNPFLCSAAIPEHHRHNHTQAVLG